MGSLTSLNSKNECSKVILFNLRNSKVKKENCEFWSKMNGIWDDINWLKRYNESKGNIFILFKWIETIV